MAQKASVGQSALAQNPAMTSLSGWVSGRQIGTALPRSVEEFLTGAFGPLSPIVPQPIDVPVSPSGRPAPRRFQYPVGWNIPIGVPGSEGLKLASFASLRKYADIYSVVRAMLNIRKEEITGLEWNIAPTDAAQERVRGDRGAARELAQRADTIQAWFERPDPNYYGFQSWFSSLLEEVFVIDALSLHLTPTRVPGKGPFGSSLGALELLAGDTIRPLLDVSGARPRPPYPAFQQYIWGVPRVDMMGVIDERDIEMMEDELGDATPDAEYQADQLLYLPYNTRTWTPYGLSPIEMALMPITIGLERQTYLLDWFSEGSVPALFVVAGEGLVTPAQQRQLQDTLNAIAGDIAQKHRIIVLPPGSKAEPQKDAQIVWQQQIDQTITEQVAMILHIQPHEIGMVPGGRTSGLGGKGMTEQQAESASETRTAPHRRWFKRTLFDWIIQRVFGQADLEWVWSDFSEEETDEEKRAGTDKSDTESGIRTIDEVRIDRGLDPFNLPLSSQPFILGAAGPIPLTEQGAKALSDLQAITAPPAPAGPPPIGPDGRPVPPPHGGTPPAAPGGFPAKKPPVAPGGPSGAATPPKTGPNPAGPSAPVSGLPSGASAPVTTPPKNGKRGKKNGKVTVADLAKWRVKYHDDKLPSTVHDYLLRSYPAKDVEWVLDPDIEWEYDPHVALADINMARRPGGRDPGKVDAIGGTLGDGASMDPVVLADFDPSDENSDAGLTIADGWHRTLGAEDAGWKDVPAFVGRKVPAKYKPLVTGNMQDDSDSKKALAAELGVLNRYLAKGRDVRAFVPRVISAAELGRIADAVTTVGRPQAIAEAVERAGVRRPEAAKDISLTIPLATGLVPFDLAGADPGPGACPDCGATLDDGRCPNGHEAKSAVASLFAGDPATVLKAIDAELTRRGITKTDFYTESGVVHPIRDSEGYDDSMAAGESRGITNANRSRLRDHLTQERQRATVPAPPQIASGSSLYGAASRAATVPLSDDAVQQVADTIARNAAEFAAQHGTVELLTQPTVYGQRPVDPKLQEAWTKAQDMRFEGEVGPQGLGTSFVQEALRYPNVVLATTDTGEGVAGAQGFRETTLSRTSYESRNLGGALKVIGNGYLGTTGIAKGTGSAVAGEFIRQAALRDAAIEIHPISTARDFWGRMGMRPWPGGMEWGMTAADAKRITAAIGSTKAERPGEPPSLTPPDEWDPDDAPNRDAYLEWLRKRQAENDGGAAPDDAPDAVKYSPDEATPPAVVVPRGDGIPSNRQVRVLSGDRAGEVGRVVDRANQRGESDPKGDHYRVIFGSTDPAAGDTRASHAGLYHGSRLLALAGTPDVEKYSDDQARDERGRWTSGGGDASGGAQDTTMWASPAPSPAVTVTEGHSFDPGRQAYFDRARALAHERPPADDPRYGQWLRHVTVVAHEAALHQYIDEPESSEFYMLAQKALTPVEADTLRLLVAEVRKYSPDQPRDDHGRFAGGGGDLTSKYPAAPLFNVRADGSRPDTMALFSRNGVWDSARVADVQTPIVEKIIAGVPKTDNPVLYMTGGGYGSGKSTMLASDAAAFPPKGDAALVDPDAIKQAIPEYQQLISPGINDPAAATEVHEESSVVAKTAVRDALATGHDVVYDTSGNSGIASLTSKIAGFRAAGATKVFGDYAFPGSVEEAQRRADARAAASGGSRRYVPPDLLAANHADVARTWLAAADAGLYDRLRLWSTAGPFGSAPSLIAEATGGKITVSDPVMYAKFRAIGGG